MDSDLGVPFAGAVLPEERWTSTLWRDEERPFDWDRAFGRVAPRVLDVGCGMGRFLIGSAVARPDRDHLGIDLLPPLIDHGVRRANQRGLTNVRFVAGDAVTWLFERLAPDSVDEIHVYHPKPCLDAVETVLTPAFFERAWRVARGRALLVLQTDHKAYGRHLLEAARSHFDPERAAGPWPDAPLGRTRREIVARRKKMSILRIVAHRRDAPRGAKDSLPSEAPL